MLRLFDERIYDLWSNSEDNRLFATYHFFRDDSMPSFLGLPSTIFAEEWLRTLIALKTKEQIFCTGRYTEYPN
jgi:hypothetical protein